MTWEMLLASAIYAAILAFAVWMIVWGDPK
jgi:hypothetical protein